MTHRLALVLLLAVFCMPGFCRKSKAPTASCDFTFITGIEKRLDSLNDYALTSFFASLGDTVCMNDGDYVDKFNALLFPIVERHTDASLKIVGGMSDPVKNGFLRQLEAPMTYGKAEVKALLAKVEAMELEYRWKKRLVLALQRASGGNNAGAGEDR